MYHGKLVLVPNTLKTRSPQREMCNSASDNTVPTVFLCSLSLSLQLTMAHHLSAYVQVFKSLTLTLIMRHHLSVACAAGSRDTSEV